MQNITSIIMSQRQTSKQQSFEMEALLWMTIIASQNLMYKSTSQRQIIEQYNNQRGIGRYDGSIIHFKFVFEFKNLTDYYKILRISSSYDVSDSGLYPMKQTSFMGVGYEYFDRFSIVNYESTDDVSGLGRNKETKWFLNEEETEKYPLPKSIGKTEVRYYITFNDLVTKCQRTPETIIQALTKIGGIMARLKIGMVIQFFHERNFERGLNERIFSQQKYLQQSQERKVSTKRRKRAESQIYKGVNISLNTEEEYDLGSSLVHRNFASSDENVNRKRKIKIPANIQEFRNMFSFESLHEIRVDVADLKGGYEEVLERLESIQKWQREIMLAVKIKTDWSKRESISGISSFTKK
ncbi:hypothetical protein FGO68_gene9888 [Halteria grandinella]|uniref:Uncharacterized protein n=1 Tax=Halteria grandinella TaxID=5974 RepID=A0A8J8T1U1_HALGN|nr:hypothetical protein FGO68_gene9888 [Halteria grandinella]